MSYILEALRRAEAERERGAVPGLHSHTAPPPAGEAPASLAARPWAWIGVGAAVGLLVPLAAWWFWGSQPQATGVVAAPPAAPASPALPPAPPAREAAAPVPRDPAPPVVAIAPPVVERVAPPPPPPAPAPVPAQPAAATPAAPSPAAAEPAPPPTTEARIYRQAELPDEVRRNLPALTVNGSVYSPLRADRLLILNGRPVREGEAVAQDLTLEEIRLKSAVLRYRDYRYTIDY
ncbi:general secretion pathway protein GspB [Caldimonas thermodepolymerans]|jgi:Predicted membrane protein|uniref:Type II secretion system protein B n=1 Tax=Caldimonas thermodepolymerans TaxID=215580 RepID=A0A2S5T6R7_9BURK|nr:general secretion pathway protein GspB [Caldimonas thermodepolymerans]PPE70671.1 hypothetical protein C1702_05870 [Caldimonas thermodepolymerans]QPC33242.1 general secretion pathway protein GspB [Caldimonas thermodepolymerans]RDH97565.1 type II secretion system protein B [Caldimonas thermodepolymerans]TCP09977.1 type II secretion system protein B [Caldimonas thermodepolymerans]UZG42690.1 general secretion pathway protein GspB [Caldimonas thermodepolymerans]